MKYLLISLGFLVLAWRWRAWRDAVQSQKKRVKPTTPATTAMVPCKQCGVHVPAMESIVGNQGVYCSHTHRLLAEF